MLVDVHAHLDSEEFSIDIDDVMERANAAGMAYIINCGLNPKSNRKTAELSKKFPLIKPAFGFYPSHAIEATEAEIENEISFIAKSNPFAISEVGLEFMKCGMIERQKKVFGMFIGLAEKLNVPLIVHSRKAEQEVFDMLKSSNARKVVMHCFTGSLSLAKKIADEHWCFSIPTSIMYSGQFCQLVKAVPLQSILTETDSPYLGPVKGERNEPSNVRFTLNKIAELKNLDKLEVEKLVFMNFQRVFLQK